MEIDLIVASIAKDGHREALSELKTIASGSQTYMLQLRDKHNNTL